VVWCWPSRPTLASTGSNKDLDGVRGVRLFPRCPEEDAGYFYRGNLTFVLFELELRICLAHVVGRAATVCAKPFLRSGIPTDFLVFH
jgi:hypothetical protein